MTEIDEEFDPVAELPSDLSEDDAKRISYTAVGDYIREVTPRRFLIES